MSWLKCLCLLLMFSPFIALAADPVRIIPPQSGFDASHDYFHKLIQLALSKSTSLNPSEKAPDVIFTYPMEQGRALMELKSGKDIDIYWAGTTPKRENDLIAIKIPLVKGLLGYRIPIILEGEEKKFEQVEDIHSLAKLTACQGAHWPDSVILETAGIRVFRNSIYEHLFDMLNAGRCDYFPRGIHEGIAEVEARAERLPHLRIYESLLIYYPFPMYYFVSQNNPILAERLRKGLEMAIDDGSFDHHLRYHPATKHLFPLDKWFSRRVIKIDNPLLPEGVDINNPRYWIMPN